MDECNMDLDNDLLKSLVSSLPVINHDLDQSIPLSIQDTSIEANGSEESTVTVDFNKEGNSDESLSVTDESSIDRNGSESSSVTDGSRISTTNGIDINWCMNQGHRFLQDCIDEMVEDSSKPWYKPLWFPDVIVTIDKSPIFDQYYLRDHINRNKCGNKYNILTFLHCGWSDLPPVYNFPKNKYPIEQKVLVGSYLRTILICLPITVASNYSTTGQLATSPNT